MYASSINYVESEDQKEKFIKISNQLNQIISENRDLKSMNSDLNTEQMNLLKINSDLINIANNLKYDINNQKENIKNLIISNKSLLEKSNARDKKLKKIQESTQLSTDLEKKQASDSAILAKIAQQESDRKEKCRRYLRIHRDDDDYLIRRGCSDFIIKQPMTATCVGYDGPGGPCNDGPGGGLYDGPNGPCYDGPGGPCYDGPGGNGPCPAQCR